MSKRKRGGEESDSDVPAEEKAFRMEVQRLKAQLTHGIKSLHAALKLARGFERQKLGRRQKAANDEPHTLLRLREEVIVLKQMSVGRTARTSLVKHLIKAKRIREHPAFIQVYGPDPKLEAPKSVAEGNVIGRLFNSAPVKQVMPGVMKNIYQVLRIPQADSGKPVKKEASNLEHSRKSGSLGDEDVFDGFSAEGSIGGNSISNSEMDDLLDDYAEDRLAFSDDETDDDSTSDRANGAGQLKDSLRAAARNPSISPSPSPSPTLDADELRTKSLKPVKPVTSTAFLPSLSLGGYYSGSDSDEPEVHHHHSGPPLPKPRKNRRGQRARQRLAEMKHGKHANHIANQKEQLRRNDGWDAKRGAVAASDDPRSRFRPRDVKGTQKSADAAVPSVGKPPKSKPTRRDDQGSLHPSWEAAKKRKMQDQPQVTFTGKKITFE
ncbi:Bud-site selection protein [Exophiala viscosa]|uniref:Bud-site selection protein n=1 Tax=Exophiala viscosa TaxID=2486360 RepID=UPI00219EB52E|nr:Bud-site selection protein [Exophiala viscosa]